MIKAIKSFISPTEFTGYHMFAIICMFFGTIISVNMVLAYNAGATWTGLVVKNTYVASQFFNEKTKILEQQQALGWTSDVTYSDGQIRITLNDQNGVVIQSAALSAKIGHPAHETNDHQVSFTQIGEIYVAETDLSGGLWQIDLSVSAQNGQAWNKSTRLVIGE